jgi:putative transposase
MAYSVDLRERAVAAVERGDHTQAEVAELFGVSQSTLEKWLHQWRTTGVLALETDRCGRRRVLAGVEEVVQAEVKAQPDATLDELCERVSAKTGVAASRSVMCRELQRLGLRRKKDAAPQGPSARQRAEQ